MDGEIAAGVRQLVQNNPGIPLEVPAFIDVSDPENLWTPYVKARVNQGLREDQHDLHILIGQKLGVTT